MLLGIKFYIFDLMILITGATGLIGSHAALYLLSKDILVRAIYRNETALTDTQNLFRAYDKEHLFNKIEWICADITDIPALEPAFKDVTEVWHCAALISFNRLDDEKMRKINIEGTANMVNLSIDFNVEKFCFISSIAALGDVKHPSEIINEEMEWNPEKHHSDYAITKYGAEMEVWRGHQEGLKTLIVNPGVVLGPGFWHRGSGEVFSAINDDLPFYTLGSTGIVAVTDLVEIMFLLMNKGEFGQRFAIIAENIMYRQLSNMIADALQKKRPTIHAKPWMTELSWLTDYIVSAFSNKKRRFFKETSRIVHIHEQYSNEKVVKVLNYEFSNIDKYIASVVATQKKLEIGKNK